MPSQTLLQPGVLFWLHDEDRGTFEVQTVDEDGYVFAICVEEGDTTDEGTSVALSPTLLCVSEWGVWG